MTIRLSKLGQSRALEHVADLLNRLGLRERTVLLSGATYLTVATLLVYVTLPALQQRINEHFQSRAEKMIQAIDSPAAATAIGFQDLSTLQSQLDLLQALNADVDRVSIYGPVDGGYAVIATTEQGMLGTRASPEEVEPIYANKIKFTERIVDGRPVMEVLGPIHRGGNVVAVASVDMLSSRRDEWIYRVRLVAALSICIGMVSLLVLLYVYLDWTILAPVRKLVAASHQVAAGNFGARVGLRRPGPRCWELRNCVHSGCPAFGRTDLRCWLAPHTLGRGRSLTNSSDRQSVCRQCQVYQQRRGNELVQLADTFDYMALAVHRHSEALESLATTDGLTGIANHRTLHQQLQREISRARRQAGYLSVMMIDIDRFKLLNDRFGHPTGDAILRQVAATLVSQIRTTDLGARCGGDEFAVVLTDADATAAKAIGERIREAVLTQFYPGCNGEAVSVSIGISAYPADGSDEETLIACADYALYAAKRQGRNRVCVYSADS